jgi:hypothetical protein
MNGGAASGETWCEGGRGAYKVRRGTDCFDDFSSAALEPYVNETPIDVIAMA